MRACWATFATNFRGRSTPEIKHYRHNCWFHRSSFLFSNFYRALGVNNPNSSQENFTVNKTIATSNDSILKRKFFLSENHNLQATKLSELSRTFANFNRDLRKKFFCFDGVYLGFFGNLICNCNFSFYIQYSSGKTAHTYIVYSNKLSELSASPLLALSN